MHVAGSARDGNEFVALKRETCICVSATDFGPELYDAVGLGLRESGSVHRAEGDEAAALGSSIAIPAQNEGVSSLGRKQLPAFPVYDSSPEMQNS